ncbi:MAG: hypothetical protein AAF515_07050 [Pseudomonadota bacterium]
MSTGFGKKLIAFAAALVVAHVLGATAAAQHVINAFGAVAEPVGIAERIAWTLRDIKGMALDGALPIYPVMVFAALLLGFAVVGMIVRRRDDLRVIGFCAAGFVGFVVAHLFLNWAGELHLVAATRTTLGLIAQGLAGAAGGYVYARLTRTAAWTG